MTQTKQTIQIVETVAVRPAANANVASEAKANVDRIVALNANLLAAA